jgi:hypothetical protein
MIYAVFIDAKVEVQVEVPDGKPDAERVAADVAQARLSATSLPSGISWCGDYEVTETVAAGNTNS